MRAKADGDAPHDEQPHRVVPEPDHAGRFSLETVAGT